MIASNSTLESSGLTWFKDMVSSFRYRYFESFKCYDSTTIKSIFNRQNIAFVSLLWLANSYFDFLRKIKLRITNSIKDGDGLVY